MSSSTRQEERLLSADELKVAADLRRRMANLPRLDGSEQAIRLFEKTNSNAQLVSAVAKQA
jgi:transcription termination factor Rho